MTITYSFSGNGNSTYAIGSLVDWHSSALIADQIQVLLNDVELVDGVGYEINEGAKALVLTSPASGSDTITINRVTPDTFFSTLETVGAASATSTLSNDQQLMNRIQEVEADIVVASANTTIQDNNGNLFGILKPGSNVGFSFNAGDGSLTISSTGGDGNGSVSAIDVDFAEGIGPQSGTSFVLSAANTGFATTVVSDDLQAQINQLNSDLGGYVQASGFNSLFDGRFDTRIADYNVKTISSPNGTLTITENGAGNFELETAGGQSVSSLQGQAGDLLMDMRVDGADTGVSNRIGLDGCSHDPTTPTFAGVTPAGTATGVEGWSWIHDLGAGSFVSHKPLSGTRDSELIGDKTLTLSGTLAGDANDEIKLDPADRLVQAGFADERYHIKSEWQETAQGGGVGLSTLYDDTGISKNAYTSRQLYLAPIDANGSADTTSGYIYPDQFVGKTSLGETPRPASSYDYTGYHPGARYVAFDSSKHTRPIFYPGVSYTLHSQAPIVPGQVDYNANFAGDTAQYWADSGITEPLPGSGNIYRDAPARLFAVSDTQDTWTAGDTYTNEFGGTSASYMDPVNGVPKTDRYGLIMHQSNSGFSPESENRMNIFYVPANKAGGVMTINATFNWYADMPRAYILLFAGMDEANKTLGPAESIIPVAGLNSDSLGGLGNYQETLSYSFNMSDGLPRYFGFASGHWNDGDSRSQGVTVTLSRSTTSSQTDYHLAALDDSASSNWRFRRNVYDRYVQDVLETYSVSQ